MHSLPSPFGLLFRVIAFAAVALCSAGAAAVEDERPVVKDSATEPAPRVNPTLPTLFVVGDSTARSDAPLRGWGSEIGAFFDSAKINVVNRAIGGRSSRTFMTEGRWDKVLAELKPGDFVLVQFGHNDDGDYHDPKAKGRPSIRGDGEETAEAIKGDLKTMETIHTFGWYLRKYATDTKARGATPILLTKVPHKDWKDGRISREHDVATFVPWTESAAKATGALYVDVNAVVSAGFERLGPEKVEPLFGDRRTHSSPAGAKYNAAAVIAGLKALQPNPLASYFSPLANDLPPTLLPP